MENIKRIKLRDFEIGGDKLTILAGPCAIESIEILEQAAEGLKKITEELDINLYSNLLLIKQIVHLLLHLEGLDWKKGLKCLKLLKKSMICR